MASTLHEDQCTLIIIQSDTKKTGTFENPTKLKHFYGESTLLTATLIHDY